MITSNQFTQMFPRAKDAAELVEAMNDIFPKYNIDTPQRIAGFIAQTGHESAGFRAFSENLNYCAKSLDVVFGKYFKRAGVDADEYAREPEKIANHVYANRMKNGDEDSGDGYTFRGGGILQLTGRDNYTRFGKSVGMTAEEAVDYVRTPKGAIESACWFWKANRLNKYCDSSDIKMLTKRINGGYIGLEERINNWNAALAAMGVEYAECDAEVEHEDLDVEDIGILKRGMRGEGVKMMQEAIGIVSVDGVFGPGTEKAVKRWQSDHGLTADGVVGPLTLDKMFV
ncbi:peptidoglycan-binding protein [Neptunomonas antarctica]|uniref:Putative chitinase n=1 Tax=Neptunomonas antarctica TaxID=619304 RepID=A0A1N7K3K2_9GAMM|nr:peptidoglycan-binding protein [Neptunomonas antarctica]SIS56175.1 putative chitinase [Neptunomonas antarctica]